jgi:SAM-dependent methyltransferase
MDTNNKYSQMQLRHYDAEANVWTPENREPVVGSFDAHNIWKGYDNLFAGIENLDQKICLDFACGPGRSLSLYYDKFKRIDGVDISKINLQKAWDWLNFNKQNHKPVKLFQCNGVDLREIGSNQYDMVISTIALQHICVYEIRYNYFKEFYRVLKPRGIISIQMGFGEKTDSKNSVDYCENNYEAQGTNGQCDTRVESSIQLERDLLEIGFSNFSFIIDDTGPGDGHNNWIYFKATK